MVFQESTILVIGSLNLDLSIRCPHLPAPGETILGGPLIESPGGKGGNQAVAAGRLGGKVAMIGCLGADDYGRGLRNKLIASNVAVECVLERGPRSGVALIQVGDDGENSIVVVPGANALVEPADVLRAVDRAPGARLMLLQLEIPLGTVEEAARLGRARGITVLLDPAPAQPLSDSLLAHIDVLLPNEHEAAVLAGLTNDGPDQALEAARRLQARGPRTVLVKLGSRGVLLVDGAEAQHFAGRKVTAVDTTAAGDSLAGALAVALDEGMPLPKAVAFANVAAALSTTRPGAQDSMPDRSEVDRAMQR